MTLTSYIETVNHWECTMDHYEITKLISECQLMELKLNSLYCTEKGDIKKTIKKIQLDANDESKLLGKVNSALKKIGGVIKMIWTAIKTAVNKFVNWIENNAKNEARHVKKMLDAMEWDPSEESLATLKSLNPGTHPEYVFESSEYFTEASESEDEIADKFLKIFKRAWGIETPAARKGASEYSKIIAAISINMDSDYELNIGIKSLPLLKKLASDKHIDTNIDAAAVNDLPDRIRTKSNMMKLRDVLEKISENGIEPRIVTIEKGKKDEKKQIEKIPMTNKIAAEYYNRVLKTQQVVAKDIITIDNKQKHIANVLKALTALKP